MKTLEVLLKEGTEALKKAEIEEAALDAWILLEYVTGISRTFYFMDKEKEVCCEKEERYRCMIQKRAERIPLQHITHQAFFMGYEFYVNEHVLIPRQDTEILVEEALRLLEGKETPGILDMCTGSGCILQSILMERSDAEGVAVDISLPALEVARKNAGNLGVEQRINFQHSDLFSGEFFQKKCGTDIEKYDMLISNPPYIATDEIEKLMDEVRLHDPKLALDGKEDGLYFYKKITKESVRFLKNGGYLLYEIGYDQAEAVSALMQEAGYENIKVLKDLAGLDRVVTGFWNGI